MRLLQPELNSPKVLDELKPLAVALQAHDRKVHVAGVERQALREGPEHHHARRLLRKRFLLESAHSQYLDGGVNSFDYNGSLVRKLVQLLLVLLVECVYFPAHVLEEPLFYELTRLLLPHACWICTEFAAGACGALLSCSSAA